jgi:glycerophosphoryl diester phosphodiesterase
MYLRLSLMTGMFLLLGTLFNSTVSGQTVSVMPVQSMPVQHWMNIAHRGASFLAPENTLIAYRIAISAGANGAECDVYSTADGVLVLSHDRTTKRTMGGGDQDITKLNFEDIRKFDAGHWKGKQFQNEKVPTLDEYLALLKGTSCHPVIEIKMDGIEQPVLDAIYKHNMINETAIIAFSTNVVKKIRQLEPNICVAFLYSENLKDKGTAEENADRLFETLIRYSKELDTVVLDLAHSILSEKLVKKLKDAGIHVWCWTVNDTKRMETLLDWGVESITTGRPELFNEVLKKQKTK